MKTRTPSMLTKPITAIGNWPFLSVVAGLTMLVFSPVARAQCNQGCFQSFNTVFGEGAMPNPFNSYGNTAIGFETLQDEAAGDDNTAVGSSALAGFFSGTGNTAVGSTALLNPRGGNYNTVVGFKAMGTGSTCGVPSDNTAVGAFALNADCGGVANTATGSNALFSNDEGSYNTADGSGALYSNTTGIWNTASGWGALSSNIDGSYNTADGLQALLSNTTGNDNTAVGLSALFANTTGSSNIALGSGAGVNLTTGSNNIDIGNRGVAGESAKIRIGTQGTQTATYIAGIYQVPLGRVALPVAIDSSGHLGTKSSSARFKQNIKPMDKASEAILGLNPVTFNYKKELDPQGTAQFGLIAEEVTKVNPDLVVRDEEGKPYTIRYEAVNAMLLNEFLKTHRKLDEQAALNRQQEASIARLESMVKEQALQLQKVSAQLTAKKTAPRVVATDL